VTSSFGEYRSGHYHGGLDFSTGGRIGLAVHAPQAGWVYRLRASGIGYGRAIYYRFLDGRTAVFAHLSRYAPPLQAEVERRQDAEGSYEVDFRPAPGAFPFEAGAILGYNGDSGAGPAHLHAEIRVGEEAAVAINPERLGWGAGDTEPPRLTRLRVVPATPGVLVDGGTDPVVIPLAASARAEITVTGPVRAWAEATDRYRLGGSALAPYRIRARLDGRPVSETTFDRFDWNYPAEVEVTFFEPLARRRGERWIRLDSPARTRQAVARPPVADGPWGHRLPPGEHDLEITAEDFAGHRVVREVLWRVAPVVPGTAPAGPSPDRVVWTGRGSYLEARFPPRVGAPQVRDAGGRPEEELWTEFPLGEGVLRQIGPPLRAEERGLRWFRWTGPGGADSVAAVWVPAAAAGRQAVSYRGLELRIRPGATYEDLWILLDRPRDLPDPGNETELTPVAPAYRLTPWAEPLRERIWAILSPPVGTDPAGLGVYSRRDDGWSYEGAETAEGGCLAVRLSNLEEVALWRDRRAPRILAVHPAAGDTTGSSPRIEAVLRETGSGIARRQVRLTLDGGPVIAEWDADANTLRAHLRRNLSAGPHRLEVEAVDRAGNRSRRASGFVVR